MRNASQLSGENREHTLFQTDVSTLQHVTKELEGALKHITTPHYRRVSRSVK